MATSRNSRLADDLRPQVKGVLGRLPFLEGERWEAGVIYQISPQLVLSDQSVVVMGLPARTARVIGVRS